MGNLQFQDGLTPVLEKFTGVDALILGSPIYFGTVTGEMRSFFERAASPFLSLEILGSSIFPKRLRPGLIFNLGADEDGIKTMQLDSHFALTGMILGRIFGSAESLVVTGTDLFDDYTKYVCSHDAAAKAKQRREEKFPVDCQKASIWVQGLRKKTRCK